MANPKVDYVLSAAKKGTQGHTCHADGCDKAVAPAMFMCYRHWRMVPRRLQQAIWETYEPGQEIDKNPTGAYVRAAMEAIKAVREREA